MRTPKDWTIAYTRGVEAFHQDTPVHLNPYQNGSQDARDWDTGFLDAVDQHKQAAQ